MLLIIFVCEHFTHCELWVELRKGKEIIKPGWCWKLGDRDVKRSRNNLHCPAATYSILIKFIHMSGELLCYVKFSTSFISLYLLFFPLFRSALFLIGRKSPSSLVRQFCLLFPQINEEFNYIFLICCTNKKSNKKIKINGRVCELFKSTLSLESV